MEVLLREQLPARAVQTGKHFTAGLEHLIGRGGLVAVRGLGLLLGMEFDTAARCATFSRAAVHEGLILNWTLHRDTVVRLAPPLTLAESELAQALAAISRALARPSSD